MGGLEGMKEGEGGLEVRRRGQGRRGGKRLGDNMKGGTRGGDEWGEKEGWGRGRRRRWREEEMGRIEQRDH